MSCGCAVLPSSFDQFREIWHVDFEFRTDDCHRPVPVAMFAKEHRSGAEIALRRDQLLALKRAPFGTGTDALMTAYAAVAEDTCFQVLGWPCPRWVLCTYFETSAAINGQEIVGLEMKRPSLIEACDLFGIPHPHMSAEYKARMRDLILNNTSYTEEQWREIETYVRGDVLLEAKLFEALCLTMKPVGEPDAGNPHV
jgi:hypothetical protein